MHAAIVRWCVTSGQPRARDDPMPGQVHLTEALLKEPMLSFDLWDDALQDAQQFVLEDQQGAGEADLALKADAHVRFHALPSELDPSATHRPPISAVGSHHIGKLVTLNGTLTRASTVKMFEYKKVWVPGRCAPLSCFPKLSAVVRSGTNAHAVTSNSV